VCVCVCECIIIVSVSAWPTDGCVTEDLVWVADGDVSVDADERGRPDGGRVGEVGERQDEHDDERLAVLLVDSRVQTAQLHHRVDAVTSARPRAGRPRVRQG